MVDTTNECSRNCKILFARRTINFDTKGISFDALVNVLKSAATYSLKYLTTLGIPELTNSNAQLLRKYEFGKEKLSQNWWHSVLYDAQLGWSADDYDAAVKLRLDENLERNLNELDSQGTTALHAAVKLENRNAQYAAIEGLLWRGADINVLDCHGKTAMAYLPIDLANPSAFCFIAHMNALVHFGLCVSAQNRKWYSDWQNSIFSQWQYCNDDPDTDEIKKYSYHSLFLKQSRQEIECLQSTRIDDDQMSLADVLKELSDEQLLLHADDLQTVVNSPDFGEKFKYFRGLIVQKCRQAVYMRHVRRKQLEPLACRAVEILSGLPHLCDKAIVSFLTLNDIYLLQSLQFDHIGTIDETVDERTMRKT